MELRRAGGGWEYYSDGSKDCGFLYSSSFVVTTTWLQAYGGGLRDGRHTRAAHATGSVPTVA